MILARVAPTDVSMYGVLIQGHIPFAVTLERPWRNNERRVSCIPTGTYECRRVKSPKFGDTFQVMHVPNRSEILFHKGNLEDDTHGCICVGEAFNPVLGRPGITQSGAGFGELMHLLRMTNSFALTIVNAFEMYIPRDFMDAVRR